MSNDVNERAALRGIAPIVGRPRKPVPADAAERIRELAADGWSIIGCAAKFGISKPTFVAWLKEYPELQAAFELGREQERHALHNLLFRRAVEGEGKDSTLCAMFLLNSRHNYRTDNHGDGDARVNVTINLPAAQPMSKFIEVENADGTECHRISATRS